VSPGGILALSECHGKLVRLERCKTLFNLKSMRARVVRLERVARELSEEAERVKDAEQSELLPAERKACLNAVYDGIAGLEAARVVMAKAVKRIEDSPLGESVVDDAA
jgi:hypothetical protein